MAFRYVPPSKSQWLLANIFLFVEKYKIPDEDASVWADHDEDCHGSYESFENDPLYASGFLWGCCEAKVTDEGCMSTKHRAASPVEDDA